MQSKESFDLDTEGKQQIKILFLVTRIFNRLDYDNMLNLYNFFLGLYVIRIRSK
jgi:hypothetical protein